MAQEGNVTWQRGEEGPRAASTAPTAPRTQPRACPFSLGVWTCPITPEPAPPAAGQCLAVSRSAANPHAWSANHHSPVIIISPDSTGAGAQQAVLTRVSQGFVVRGRLDCSYRWLPRTHVWWVRLAGITGGACGWDIPCGLRTSLGLPDSMAAGFQG